MFIVTAIAFVAAIQGTSFTKLEGFAFTSITTTGNVRRMVEGLLDGTIFVKDPESLKSGLDFTYVCFGFFLGALLGAYLTLIWHGAALLVAVVVLSAAFIHCLPWNRRIQHLFHRIER